MRIDLFVLLWLSNLVLLPILAGVIGACSNHAPHKEFWTLKFPIFTKSFFSLLDLFYRKYIKKAKLRNGEMAANSDS